MPIFSNGLRDKAVVSLIAMNPEKEQQILQALRSVKDPDLGRDIVELGFVKNLKIEGKRLPLPLN